MSPIPFTKMHGLGNDFVVIDARDRPLHLSERQVRAIADRHTGIGCDQLIIVEPSTCGGLTDALMRIRNADGSEAAACGNASRCVARMLMEGGDTRHVIIETAAGLLDAEAEEDGTISIDMGRIRFDWRDIPLAKPVDTLHLGITAGPLTDPVAVSVGNPHAVFFVDDAQGVPLETLGPLVEHHPLFPERTNVGVAQVRAPGRIRLRVWERGAGITRACGTAACAAVAAAHRRGLTGRAAEVLLDGGRLDIEWLRDEHVLMRGPASVSFTGVVDETLLA